MQKIFREFEEHVFFDLWIPHSGSVFWFSDSGFRIPDSGFWFPDSGFRFQIPVSGFWVLGLPGRSCCFLVSFI